MDGADVIVGHHGDVVSIMAGTACSGRGTGTPVVRQGRHMVKAHHVAVVGRRGGRAREGPLNFVVLGSHQGIKIHKEGVGVLLLLLLLLDGCCCGCCCCCGYGCRNRHAGTRGKLGRKTRRCRRTPAKRKGEPLHAFIAAAAGGGGITTYYYRRRINLLLVAAQ